MNVIAIVIFSLVVMALGILRIWAFHAGQNRRFKDLDRRIERNTPQCQKHCEKLAAVTELVSNCPEGSRARVLVEQAKGYLFMRRPTGIYQWRQANEVDDLHESALNMLIEAEQLAAQC